MQAFQPVVIAPTFNNARTLERVLAGLEPTGLPVIVVNDGCEDGSDLILRRWRCAGPNRVVISHARNLGKAAALRSGFWQAWQMGFSHAVTIDTDGQLDPSEVQTLLRVSRRSPGALVVGSRNKKAPGYPRASQVGRWASNVLVHWQSGLRVSDSQCGFRVYPLAATVGLDCFASRYGFETEILTRAAWAGIAVRQCPVRCVYTMPEGRVSHFRPWRDSLSCAAMHMGLLVRSLTPFKGQKIRHPRSSLATGMIWQRLARWLSPLRSWRAIRHDRAERANFAKGMATGVFVANLPVYGLQTVLCLYAARRLKINPVPVLIGSHVATPPLGPVLIAAAIAIGHLILHGRWPALSHFDPSAIGYAALLRSVIVEWLIGSVVCGALLAGMTYLMTRLVIRMVPLHTPEASTAHSGGRDSARDRAIEQPVA